MKKYAVSMYARKTEGINIIAEHRVDIIEANNYDEALGQAYNKSKELYLPTEGWCAHNVVIMEISEK